jgi:integrase/recombinase XerD
VGEGSPLKNVEVSDVVFPEVAEEFFNWLVVERGRAANTVEAYRRDIAQYLLYLSDKRSSLMKAQVEDVENFLTQRLENGAAKTSLARQFSALRMLHRFMVEERFRKDDPAVMAEGVGKPAGIPKPLSEDEMTLLIGSVVGDEPRQLRDRAVLEFLYATGARVSEVCGLNLSDLDMESSLVRLFGKGSKERVVPFGSIAHGALGQWLASGRYALEPAQWRRRDDAQAVFLANRGARISRQVIFNIVREAGLRAKIDRVISPHALRHSCATHLLDHGDGITIQTIGN